MRSGTTDPGVAVAKGGAYELLETGCAKCGYEGVVGGCDDLCQEHRDAHRGKPLSNMDKQIEKQERHRPKARMDHCTLMEVLYYALCGNEES